MKRVEQHIIKKGHPYYMECDVLCFKAKNVYNSTLYYFRQNYFKGEIVSYLDSYHHIKHTEAYKSLPTKVAKQSIRQAENAKTSFFRTKRDYAKNPHKYLGEPRLPKYKNPEKGRQVCSYEKDSIYKSIWDKEQLIALSGTSIKIKPWKATYDNVRCARIIPKNNYFVIEIVYEIFLREIVREKEGITAAIDLGIDNLATLAFGAKNIQPLIFNGKAAKSVNQYYNKKKAFLQQCLEKDQYWSKNLGRLTDKRNHKLKDIFHKISREIVNQLVLHNVTELIIGYNKLWKQGINLGKNTNQKFVMLPYRNLINMITYKCQEQGITVIENEESYTSKCSFLDLEPIKKHTKYKGTRKKRMFVSKKFGVINADVNAAYNILRKVFPKVFAGGIEGFAVSPVRITPH